VKRFVTLTLCFVCLSLSSAYAQTIRQAVIEGNTLIAREELVAVLELTPGDAFNEAQAARDFTALRERYREAGFLLAATPVFSFTDGRYLQRLTELTVAEARVRFVNADGATVTGRSDANFVAAYFSTRGVYQADRIASAIQDLRALPTIDDVTVTPTVTTLGSRDVVVLDIDVQEAELGLLDKVDPLIGAEFDSGFDLFFEAGVRYSLPNLFGQTHRASVAGVLYTTDNGVQLGGEVAYAVPRFGLFSGERPTSLAIALSSFVDANVPLRANGRLQIPHPCVAAGTCRADDANLVRIGETTQRTTGMQFSVARALNDTSRLAVGVRFELLDYDYETGETCAFDTSGDTSGDLDGGCDLSESQARVYQEQDGGFAFADITLSRDTRDNDRFARRGYYAFSRIGLGFGDDYRNRTTLQQDSYAFIPLESEVRAYFTPLNSNQVLATRLGAGTALAGGLPYSRLFKVGDTDNYRYQLRGYGGDDILPSQNYVTGSLEYRIDPGFDLPLTEQLVIYGFADTGFTSNDFGGDSPGMHVGIGVGTQVRLELFGISAPPIKIDYAFSDTNRAGKLHFGLDELF
jgi:outer membrane protein insertion porin family